ncbi:glucose-methanol-choline oxidoreductase [Paenibacillus rigui]|uniref:Glucose-methanol-choline oxidoreductase n=1 Tax=Paenibacillus rigui TaxID=554312 RepID=A0A229UKC7_9BACL|nr:glucose-methanol-choline oxidoreductase [Paenibacillus rigui]
MVYEDVKLLRKYVARSGDTLRFVAHHLDMDLGHLMLENPHIALPDSDIAGQVITIPSETHPASQQRLIAPFCPPLTEPEYLRTWIPLTTAEQMAAEEYDVLIIGTGAGGGAALWRLCEQWGKNGKKIGIVERGPLFVPTHVANIATINFNTFRAYRPPEVTYMAGDYLPQFPGMKLIYALGGRTLLWGAVSPRMYPGEFADWPVTAAEMEFYYKIAENVMNVTTDYTKDSTVTQILLKRLWENGYPEALDIPIATELTPTQLGHIRSNVFFSSILFFARALSKRPFDLAVNTTAVQVLTENGRAAGVRVMTPDRRSHVIRAKTVIVSASALQTARLLLNSKIPGPAIGHYLTNHSYLVATPKVNTTGFPDELGTLGILVPQSAGRPYQLQFQGLEQYFHYQYEEKPRKNEWDLTYFVSGKVESRFENMVYIDPNRIDYYGMPEPQIRFSYSAKDGEVIRLMETAMRQAASTMQLSFPPGSVCMMPPGTDNHESGTCRMGTNPSTSATNAYGQIHGIPGLYCADASVLPSIGATNPTLTIVALAIRTADYIAREMQSN